jgi:hypothetical protein
MASFEDTREQAKYAASTPVRHKSCCRAIKTRATKRSIAILVAEARLSNSGNFSVLGFR